jgi:excisionase family DNA binding protein
MCPCQKNESPEKLYTIRQVAALLNIPPWKLRRSIKRGLIPCHRLLNSRRLLRLSEVLAAIDSGDQP